MRLLKKLLRLPECMILGHAWTTVVIEHGSWPKELQGKPTDTSDKLLEKFQKGSQMYCKRCGAIYSKSGGPASHGGCLP